MIVAIKYQLPALAKTLVTLALNHRALYYTHILLSRIRYKHTSIAPSHAQIQAIIRHKQQISRGNTRGSQSQRQQQRFLPATILCQQQRQEHSVPIFFPQYQPHHSAVNNPTVHPATKQEENLPPQHHQDSRPSQGYSTAQASQAEISREEGAEEG